MNLRFTPEAASELEEILEYLADRSPIAAHNVARRMQEILAQVSDYPLTGIRTNYRGMRRITVLPYAYLIYYLAAEGEVVVVGIRHAARDPRTMPDANPDSTV